MPRKPAHEQFDTRGVILERAFVLFGRFGYEGVSIGDIAQAAQISRGALYWHFKGKDELYLACLGDLHAIFNRYLFDPMRAESDGLKRHLLVISGLTDMLQDPQVHTGISGYWTIPSQPETGALVQAHRDFESRCVETMRETLQRGVDQGHFDYKDDLDAMARAIISLVEAVVLPLRHQSPEEVRQTLAVLMRTLLRAYGQDEGQLALTRAP